MPRVPIADGVLAMRCCVAGVRAAAPPPPPPPAATQTFAAPEFQNTLLYNID